MPESRTNLLEEIVAYRKNVTGVDNTIFISSKGDTRHAAHMRIALDPPDTVDPRSRTASIAIADGAVVAGEVPHELLYRARHFIELNRAVLLDYWDYKIDTDQLRQRMRSIDP